MAKDIFAKMVVIFILSISMGLSCSNNSGNDSKQTDSPYDLVIYNATTSPSLPVTFKTNDRTSVSFTAFISNKGAFITNSLFIIATVFVTHISGMSYADIEKCYPLIANGVQYNMQTGAVLSITIPEFPPFDISQFTAPGTNYYYILTSIDDINNYEYPDKTPDDNVYQLNSTPVIVTE